MIVDEYLGWSENYHKREEDSLEVLDKPYEQDETTRLRLQHQALLDLEQDEWSKSLVAILLSFGAAETKQFFELLNEYFLQSKHRLQIVYLLSEFLLRKYDNSTTLIAMSVTNLIMLLPRICTSLPPHLPQLFYIFARALCWDQLRDIRQKQSIIPPSASSSQDDDGDDSSATPTEKSRKAADGWDCAGNNDFHMPEEFDEETFRSRTLTQVSRHMLHPNLVTMDIATELTDRSRWMKMEPPDVIAQIMSLDLTNAASRVAFSSDNKQHRSGHQPDLLDEEIWAHTGQVPRPSSSPSTAFTAEEQHHQQQRQDTTTTPGTFAAVNSILDMHRALKGGAEVLIGEDVWVTTSIAHASHLPDTTASPTPSLAMSPETKLLIAALKREVLLLRNELNFELFVKQQHLQHMGRLHREHVVDSSVEAERQRTYNTTRMLRAQLKDATNALTKLKAESALTKQKHIKWEDEQQGKLRSYREARKKWQADMEEAKQKLAEQERTAAEQHAQLLEAQRRVFEVESELRTRQPFLEKAAENEHRVMQLTKQMLLWEEDSAHLEEHKGYIKGLLSQWWSMEELVGSLQAENQRLSKVQR
ncbi:hypothetical protein BDB00DRAFT_758113 [Zychaea mexicana]|uniref:uncharacterized protein n=1 Tax=Zychaea mexicana TaxID=64656 RepID=UPI0022FEB6C5|nr:uncharacterized protein BDB00DRAFT_758113 [Zychaea mexicana]KAI9496677.1 hypothetical protein BDB00DRAFT_758113 [Zychaea mexicana]